MTFLERGNLCGSGLNIICFSQTLNYLQARRKLLSHINHFPEAFMLFIQFFLTATGAQKSPGKCRNSAGCSHGKSIKCPTTRICFNLHIFDSPAIVGATRLLHLRPHLLIFVAPAVSTSLQGHTTQCRKFCHAFCSLSVLGSKGPADSAGSRLRLRAQDLRLKALGFAANIATNTGKPFHFTFD